MTQTFDKDIIGFVRRIEAISLVYPDVLGEIGRFQVRAHKTVQSMINSEEFEVKQDGESSLQVMVPIGKIVPFTQAIRRSDRMDIAISVVAQSFIVTLVSQFDIFLGELIRSMYKAKPEILSASQKQLNYAQLLKFGSIEDATSYIIESEVESVLRDSHPDQIKWLENKLDIPLTKNLLIWPKFVELTERRNLFVHCGGVVSRQYLDMCAKHMITHTECVNTGDLLNVTPDYLQEAYKCIFQMGVMLGQVVWRKLSPGDHENADLILTSICLDLMTYEIYDLAKVLLEFGLSPAMKHSGRDAIIFQINLAQAYKWLGETDACNATLSKIDWSTQRDEFMLCKAVLEDGFELAAGYMRKLGSVESPISAHGYISWPIFREFRKSEAFSTAFTEIFGTEYEFDEKRDVDLLDTLPPLETSDDPPVEDGT